MNDNLCICHKNHMWNDLTTAYQTLCREIQYKIVDQGTEGKFVLHVQVVCTLQKWYLPLPIEGVSKYSNSAMLSFLLVDFNIVNTYAKKEIPSYYTACLPVFFSLLTLIYRRPLSFSRHGAALLGDETGRCSVAVF